MIISLIEKLLFLSIFGTEFASYLGTVNFARLCSNKCEMAEFASHEK